MTRWLLLLLLAASPAFANDAAGVQAPPPLVLWIIGAAFGAVLFFAARHRPGFAVLAASAIALAAYGLVQDPSMAANLSADEVKAYTIAAYGHGALCLIGALAGHYVHRWRQRADDVTPPQP